ncbi:MAG: sulfotransferase [Terriglobia bacterium]
MNDKIKVLYIAGTARCGSTLLGNVLGQLDDFFHAGELWHIWDDGLASNIPCGCGVPFRECRVWRGVLEKMFGKANQPRPTEIIDLRNRTTRARHLPLLFLPGARSSLGNKLKSFLAYVEGVYRKLQETTGCRVIVDSSKNPSYAYVLSLASTIELYIVHPTRDPRAVAFSQRQPKFRPDTGSYLAKVSPAKSSIVWTLWNTSISMLAGRLRPRSLRLRHEDFVENPSRAVSRVASLFKGCTLDLSFIQHGGVNLSKQHTVSGNPIRLRSGYVELHRGEEWRTRMKRRDVLLVTATTWPFLRWYGYDL